MFKNKNLAHYYINEYVDEQEITWQLEEIKSKGFDGIILSPAKGLEIGFMSPEWISISYYIFDVCKKIQLSVILSTESIYPANILETKFNYDEKDYKLHYMKLVYEAEIESNALLVSEVLNKIKYKSIEDVYIYAIKKKDNNYDLSSFFMIDKYMHEWSAPDVDDWYVVVFAETPANSSYNTLYPFNFFVKNTTLEFLDKIYTKNITLYKKYKDIFLGFYEPRLMPEIIKENAIVWYKPLIDGIEKKLKLSLFDYLPHIFFGEDKIGYKIRTEFIKSMHLSYIDNFISIIDKYVMSKDKHLILKFQNEKKDNLYKDIKSVLSLYNMKNYKFSDKTIISYDIEFDKTNNLNMVDALFVKSIKSQAIIKNSIVEIVDKYNRFNFTPSKMKILINHASIYNETNFIYSSLLYSIKGFRKNDIAPNIFYQSYFWDFISNVIDYAKNITASINKYDLEKKAFDIAVVIPEKMEFTKIIIDSKEKSFLHGLINALSKSDKEIIFINSSEINQLKVKKVNDENSFVYTNIDEKEIIISTLINLEFKDSKQLKRIDKLNEKKEILKLQLNRDISEGITIFDVEKILRFIKDTISSKRINFEDKNKSIIVKYFTDKKTDSIIYILYNTSPIERKIKFDYIYRKKNQSGHLIIKPFNLLTLSYDKLISLEDKKVVKEPKFRIIFKRNWQFKSNKKNIAPLTTWIFKVGGPKDEDVGTIHFYETKFHSNYNPQYLNLILDGVYGEKDFKNDSKPVKIFINDIEYKGSFEKMEKSHSLFMMNIADYVNKGENKIVIKSAGSHFSPITLNEPQFLEGDFVIRKKVDNNWLLDKPEKAIINGNWTENGYPFFYGTGIFEQYFEIDKKFNDIILKIDNCDAPLIITINEEHRIPVDGPSYRININDYVKVGSNRLSIEVPSSMANIFTGVKRPEGLIGETSLEIY